MEMSDSSVKGLKAWALETELGDLGDVTSLSFLISIILVPTSDSQARDSTLMLLGIMFTKCEISTK